MLWKFSVREFECKWVCLFFSPELISTALKFKKTLLKQCLCVPYPNCASCFLLQNRLELWKRWLQLALQGDIKPTEIRIKTQIDIPGYWLCNNISFISSHLCFPLLLLLFWLFWGKVLLYCSGWAGLYHVDEAGLELAWGFLSPSFYFSSSPGMYHCHHQLFRVCQI